MGMEDVSNRSSARDGIEIKGTTIETLTLSPSSIKRFESCPAGYIYTSVKGILPRIDTKEMKEQAEVGKSVHSISESDFDEEVQELQSEEKANWKAREINDFSTLASTRYYLTDITVTEVYLTMKVGEGMYLRGYADRMSRTADDRIYIVDLKTTGAPDFFSDRRQLMNYALCLIYMSEILAANPGMSDRELCSLLRINAKELGKLKTITQGKKVTADQITLVVDYLRMDEIKDVTIYPEDLARHTNYLVSIFGRVRKTVSSFLSHRDVRLIDHHPGECTFCSMKGACLAYAITVNPHYDIVEPVELSTSDIVRELIDRQEALKLNEERVKTLKRALMMRYKESDPIVVDFCTVVESTNSLWPATTVMDRVIPKLISKKAKNVQFSEMVDWSHVEQIVKDLVLGMVPKMLGPSDIPNGLKDQVEDLRVETRRPPYIKLKK